MAGTTKIGVTRSRPRPTKRALGLYLIGLAIVLMAGLNSLELSVRAHDSAGRGSPAQWFALGCALCALFGAVASTFAATRAGVRRAPLIAIWASVAIFGTLSLLAEVVNQVGMQQHHLDDRTRNALYHDKDLIPPGYVRLGRATDDSWVLGIKRGFWRHHRQVTCRYGSIDPAAAAIVPPDFVGYAPLVGQRDARWDDPCWLAALYLSWQYPDYLPLTTGSAFFEFEEDGSRWSDDGWLGELLRGEIGARFEQIEELFTLPSDPRYYRTDLEDDPYFLFHRGQRQEAEAGLDRLPSDRRAFVTRLLKGAAP